MEEQKKPQISEAEMKLILEDREKWYSFVPALFEMVKALHKRELMFLNKISQEYPHRYRFAFTVDRLKQHFERFEFFKNTYNLYHSLAVLENMPILPYTIEGLKETDEYKQFHKEYEKMTIGFEAMFDIDGKENPQEAYNQAKKIKSILEEYKVPFFVMPSSDKGIHIRIPAHYIDNYNLDLMFSVIHNIKGIFRLTCLDDTIFDSKRVTRVPYSIDSKSRCVCLPVNDIDFNMWNVEKFKVRNVMKNYHIKGRGLLIREYGLTEQELKENVKKFFQHFK